MKKHLIAAAVAAAVAVPAMAQVTISGYVEAGFVNTNNSVDTVTTQDTTRFQGGLFGSPRLVFAGTEDLGGGLKAGFRLESSLDIVTGRLGNASLSGQNAYGIFDRGVEINLSGSFGTVAFGKLDHWGIENNDLNVVGNISLADDATVEVRGVASDTNGTIRYTSPAFNGVTLNVSHTPKDNTNIANATSSGVTPVYDINDDFDGEKRHAGITSYQLMGTINGVNFRVGGGTVKDAGLNSNATATGTTRVMGGAVAYNFGPAEASLFYQTQSNPISPTNLTGADAKNMILSVKVPLSNGWDLRGNYETIDVDGASTSDQTIYTLVAAKALSKRTTVFGFYRDENKDVNGTTASNNDAKIIGINVSHSF
jgi:predicted porin